MCRLRAFMCPSLILLRSQAQLLSTLTLQRPFSSQHVCTVCPRTGVAKQTDRAGLEAIHWGFLIEISRFLLLVEQPGVPSEV